MVDRRKYNQGRPKGSKSSPNAGIPGKKASYMITLPNGYMTVTNNLRKFCRENSVSRAGMYRVLDGTYDSWRQYDIQYFGGV